MNDFSPITVIVHPACAAHLPGPEHPEQPQRLDAILQRLENGPLAAALTVREAPAAPRRWLEACHDTEYLYRFEEAALSGSTALDHQDNEMSFDTFDAARHAAGAGILGVDLAEDGHEVVFCAVRPPGHHAERRRALGFCFVNNTVVAARYWHQRYRRRVLIVDVDAHHGNGVQAAFETEPEVFYLSLHEDPAHSFPGSGYAGERGLGPGRGTTLNIPLPPGAGDEECITALTEVAAPAVAAFAPEAIVVAAGFDGHGADDMSGLNYTTALYGKLGVYLGDWARRYCRGRLLSVLEGGYHPEALAAGVEAYLAGLALTRRPAAGTNHGES